jgi:hypothetical protein
VLKRLLSRLVRTETVVAVRKPMVEPLENRTLLHNGFITGMIADDRGRAELTVDADSGSELASDAFARAAQVYTLGADGLPRTGDDVRVSATVSFKPASRKLTITANLGGAKR